MSNPVYAALTSSLVSRFNRSSEVQIEDDRKLRDRYIAASLNRKTIAGQAPPRLRSDRVRARQKTAAASRSLHAMEKSRVHRRYEATIVETCASSYTLAISRPCRVRALKLAVLPDGGSLMCNDLRTDGVGSAEGGCISVKNVFAVCLFRSTRKAENVSAFRDIYDRKCDLQLFDS